MANPPEDRVRVLSEPERPRRSRNRAPVVNPGHSDIFERLSANDDSDLIGLVAYGLYQRRKRTWLHAFHTQHGRYPSPEERNSFSFGHQADAINALRNEAENVLAAFGESVVEDQIDRLRTDALSAQTQAVLSGIDSKIATVGSYQHHIVGHLAGFLVLVGIIWLGSWIVHYEPSLEKASRWFSGGDKQTADPITPGAKPN